MADAKLADASLKDCAFQLEQGVRIQHQAVQQGAASDARKLVAAGMTNQRF